MTSSGVLIVAEIGKNFIQTQDERSASEYLDNAVGDPVEFVAGYADATVFLHDTLYGVRAGRVEAVWSVLGRGRPP